MQRQGQTPVAVSVAGWPQEPVYSEDELREMIEDILAHGSEEDRRAIAVFLALEQDRRS